ncbi:hypothetical protein DL96DRAFT_1742171 [Flagelloscypha sp. PMI_526]|nr:hypothetical protein DL96DRAFT_1742171 [Flagelloscypha sp. PMI_526]
MEYGQQQVNFIWKGYTVIQLAFKAKCNQAVQEGCLSSPTLLPSSSTMSGFEIFGTVASAIAVIEATWLVKLHITSVKHAKQEKIEMEGELKELKSLVQHISTALDRQSLPSKPALLSLVSKIGDGLNQVDKKRKGTWKVFWHLVKDDIRSVWADLERMRGFLELGLISQIG